MRGTYCYQYYIGDKRSLTLDLAACNLLLVDRLQHFAPAFYRRLGETLTLTQLQQNLRFLEFFLVLLKRFVNVFAIF